LVKTFYGSGQFYIAIWRSCPMRFPALQRFRFIMMDAYRTVSSFLINPVAPQSSILSIAWSVFPTFISLSVYITATGQTFTRAPSTTLYLVLVLSRMEERVFICWNRPVFPPSSSMPLIWLNKPFGGLAYSEKNFLSPFPVMVWEFCKAPCFYPRSSYFFHPSYNSRNLLGVLLFWYLIFFL